MRYEATRDEVSTRPLRFGKGGGYHASSSTVTSAPVLDRAINGPSSIGKRWDCDESKVCAYARNRDVMGIGSRR
jgi:hypothetical protein